MSYIIIWNVGTREHFIHTDSKGFIEDFADRKDAIKEANACIDGDQYRSFELFEEDIFKKEYIK